VEVLALENCFPMMPAGYGHQQVMLSEDNWYVEE
jgi:acetolactate synthase-1/2/3 large subunit